MVTSPGPSVPSTGPKCRQSENRLGLPRAIPGATCLHVEKQAEPVSEGRGDGWWRAEDEAPLHAPVHAGHAEVTRGQDHVGARLPTPRCGRHGAGAAGTEGRSGSSGNESSPSPLPPGRETGEWHSCVSEPVARGAGPLHPKVTVCPRRKSTVSPRWLVRKRVALPRPLRHTRLVSDGLKSQSGERPGFHTGVPQQGTPCGVSASERGTVLRCPTL